MESFNIVLSWDKPNCKIPAELTAETTTDLLLKANDFGFDIIKKHYINQVAQNPMLMPLLISAIGHDWVFKHHNWPEEQFKAAIFEYKIMEDPAVGQKLEQKQYELMAYM